MSDKFSVMTDDTGCDSSKTDVKQPQITATTEYCDKLQQWLWQHYWGYASRQSWLFPPPCSLPPDGSCGQTPAANFDMGQQLYDTRSWYSFPYPFSPHASFSHSDVAQTQQSSATTRLPVSGTRPVLQHNGHTPQAGREYTIPSPLQRFLAETVDFFILFCVKVTIVLWVMHLSGMKDIAKFITHFIEEEIDENTSLEDLQKMMAVALVYRVLVCIYETICIWGAGGVTPGKFLLGLRVVTCDTSTLIRHNCVLVVPASKVSFSASVVRALNKNFSIAFLFPVFITLLFFQHNRTVYDIVAGTIVVQRREAR
ncbi:protein FAM8A1 [Pholidichthys leucotaenia]